MREGWTYKKFEEVFDLQMGKTPSRDNATYWGGDNLWVSIADLKGKYINSTKEHITNIAVSESGIKVVPKGTVIMSFKLSVGRSAITEVDLYTNEAIMAFHPKGGYKLIPDYIYYYLTIHNWSGANKAVMGLTLNKKSISSNVFAFPPIEEQERIVSELDLLTSIIEKKKAQLKELDNLAQSIFYDMFGDPAINEKGWEEKKMEKICTITSSKRIFANEYCEQGVPFYRGKEITELSKGFPISIELSISQERYEEIKNEYGIPSIGDILITAVGTIGNIWVVNDDRPFYFKDGNIIWLKDIKGFNSIFFRRLLSLLIEVYKYEMAQGCAYNALTIVNLKKMKALCPPLSIQQSFAEKIEAIEKQKAFVQQSISETQTLFDSTMDKYFG